MLLLLPFTLFLATLTFGLGIVLPLLQVDRLWFFIDEPSILGIIAGLWANGDWALAIAVTLFSLVFPAMKLLLLTISACENGRKTRIPEYLRALSNWSMLDVVLVAVVIFAAKTSGLATAATKPGLLFFAASVVLTVAASYALKRRDAAG
jgi:paraquat-inducible protein A